MHLLAKGGWSRHAHPGPLENGSSGGYLHLIAMVPTYTEAILSLVTDEGWTYPLDSLRLGGPLDPTFELA